MDSERKNDSGPTQDELDPELVVGWEEPQGRDQYNPMNWSSRKKWANILTISIISFLVPLVSTMLAPAVQQVMADFNTSSETFATFVVSIYILGFACGPLLLAPLSELYGRVVIYHSTNVLFLSFTILCAFSQNQSMLLAFRFLSGFAGVATITIGSGTIADIMPREKRGKAVSIWSIGTIAGPGVGPIIGSRIAEVYGWRWIFIAISIVIGAVTVLAFAVLRETYPPVLLERKAARIRKETGNPYFRSKVALEVTSLELLKRSLIRPSKLLLCCPLVTVMCTYVAVLYSELYLLFATYSFAFTEMYDFTIFDSGLVFLPGCVATMLGLLYFGQLSDRHLKSRAAAGGTVTPEDRLPLKIILPGAFTFPAGLLIYGWSIETQVHWTVPLLGTAVTGFGSILIFISIQTYLIDAFEGYAASVIGANAVLRGTAGALLPLCGLRLYDVLGWGWGNSLLAFVALTFAPIPLILGRHGARIRDWKQNQIEL